MTDLRLRPVAPADLDAFFRWYNDPVAAHAAAFTHENPADRAAFDAHWQKLTTTASILARTICAGDAVVGHIVSWGGPGERELTYWIDRAWWGKGVATAGLAAFLREDTSRPIVGRAAKDNAGSRRVMEKCGFRLVEEGRWFAHARKAEIEEVVMRLDAAPDPVRQLLRHLLATIAYRGGKALRGAPVSFAATKTGEPSRSAVEIVSHMGDLFDWSLTMAKGAEKWNTAKPLPWDEECARFHASLKRLDDYLASDAKLHAPIERLVQGPIADALTHVGQVAMMRRMAGAPIVGENYFAADVETGRVGSDQAAPRRPFK